jgi:hypothetical protein
MNRHARATARAREDQLAVDVLPVEAAIEGK